MKPIDKLAQKYALNINQLRGPKNHKIIDFKNLNIGFYDALAKNDNSIKKNRSILKKVKESSMKEFIYSNREMPESWKQKSNYDDDILKIMIHDKEVLKYMGTGQQIETKNKSKTNENRKHKFFITRNENEKVLPDIKSTVGNKSIINEPNISQQLADSEKNPENIIEEEHIIETTDSKEPKTKRKSRPRNNLVDKDINEILEEFKVTYPIKNKLKELYEKTNYYSSKNSVNNSLAKIAGISQPKTRNLKENFLINRNQDELGINSKFERNIFYNTIKNQQIFKRKNVIKQNVFNNLISQKDSMISKSVSHKTYEKKLNPIPFSDYKSFIKKIKVKNPLVNKNLENINFYGPYFSYCPPCYNKNIEYYNNLEVNQCINLLHHIKKIKLKDNKKPEMESKIFTSKETDITVQ